MLASRTRIIDRIRTALATAHTPVPGVPQWARFAALAIQLAVLPSSIWRIAAVAFHAPLLDTAPGTDSSGNLPSWLPIEAYVIMLSIVSEVLAFTAYGLIAVWGEVFPRWVPWLRARRVRTPVAVVPATTGAVALTVLWTMVVVTAVSGHTIQGDPLPPENPMAVTWHWRGIVLFGSYAPLVLWGPLLGLLTIAYIRRRAKNPGSRHTTSVVAARAGALPSATSTEVVYDRPVMGVS